MGDDYEWLRKAERKSRLAREVSEIRWDLALDWDKSATEKLGKLKSMSYENSSEIRIEAIDIVKKDYLQSALEEHILRKSRKK